MIKPTFETEKLFFSKNYTYIAGIDEVGRGPLAGPVISCALVIDKSHIQVQNVRDSKLLSQKQRGDLFNDIKNSCVAYGIGMVSNEDIDKIGIYKAVWKSMLDSYNKTLKDIDIAIIDGENMKNFPFNYLSKNKADRDIYTVAAASIIAKVTRDEIMMEYDKMYPEYGFKNHKGYGTKSHIEAIRKYGVCPIHRMSFCRNFIN